MVNLNRNKVVNFNWNYMVNLNWNEVVNIAGICTLQFVNATIVKNKILVNKVWGVTFQHLRIARVINIYVHSQF